MRDALAIALAASVQLDACCTNFFIQEANLDLETEFLQEPFLWEEGYLIPSPKPGLGVAVNEELLERSSERISSVSRALSCENCGLVFKV